MKGDDVRPAKRIFVRSEGRERRQEDGPHLTDRQRKGQKGSGSSYICTSETAAIQGRLPEWLRGMTRIFALSELLRHHIAFAA
jgi:hypothetical protein